MPHVDIEHQRRAFALLREGFQRDLPEAEIHLLDAGHFALESNATEIAALIRDFLGRKLS